MKRPWRAFLACTALVAFLAGAINQQSSAVAANAPIDPAAQRIVAPLGTSKTLVLYDTTGQWGHLGELYAMLSANLAGRFGSADVKPISAYTGGMMSSYTGVIYVGSTYDEAIPDKFLADVVAGTKPVLWAASNIWKLTATDPNWYANWGFTWKGYDTSSFPTVTYKGRSLTRNTLNDPSGIMSYSQIDPAKVKVLATANGPAGLQVPWAIRTKNLTYVGENPYAYMNENDRYLAWSDLLFDLLAPATPERHRAMIRLEDVGPNSDPAELRAIADYLYSKRIPYSVATFTRFRDPLGITNGAPLNFNMTSTRAKGVRDALKYMESHGGFIIQHGVTHQYKNKRNPYDAVSANDFEFYLAHVDAADHVIYDGPVPEDSLNWATNLIKTGRGDFAASGLKTPTVFEFPHYAASRRDYRAVQELYGKGYDRRLYFSGQMSKPTVDYSKMVGQFFPYEVTDVHGTRVAPENLGNFEETAINGHPNRLAADIIASAERNLVVRDGYASFFYHPFLGVAHLKEIVEGIEALGTYQWVSAKTVLNA